MIQFWVAGAPKAQPRPRMTRKGHVYNPSSANEWKERIMWRARESGVRKPLIGPVKVTLSFVLSGKKDGAPHITKPDADNLEKALLDSLTAVGAWHDDAQVFDLHTVKRVGDPQGVLVTIEGA